MTKDVPIRDAATIILLRQDQGVPRLLMGQRGRSAVFMPGKFVFPGGAVDPEDYATELPGTMDPVCARRLTEGSSAELARALTVAALRELREETGLSLASAAGMQFIFRAITPPGRPRRFDARFFLAKADDVTNDPDDFSQAEDELSHLQWVTLEVARGFDLPFITRIVLAEIEERLGREIPPDHVPFYDHTGFSGELRALY